MNRFRTARVALMAAAIAATPALAQEDGGGLDRVNTVFTNLETVLTGISVVTVTIALLIFGYMLLFQATQVTWLARIIGACIIIGGASAIANFFLA